MTSYYVSTTKNNRNFVTVRKQRMHPCTLDTELQRQDGQGKKHLPADHAQIVNEC